MADTDRESLTPSQRPVGEEARKSHAARIESGFIARYLSGPNILDIGYRGYIEHVVPIVEQAIGIELDYPGYDGRTLPFPDGSQDAVFASHCLEHIIDFRQSLRDWFRVLKRGGFLIIMVPHQYLYEKRLSLPSHFNADHKRFYTPGSLMLEIEQTLEPNSYRLRHLADNDAHFDYSIPPEKHSGGCYEIELVIERIDAPQWTLNSVAEDYATEAPAGVPSPNVVSWQPLANKQSAEPSSLRIAVLKLDHFGDFIIALPALRRLRELFPTAHITLICAPWNVANIGAGVVDDILTFQFFPTDAAAWYGRPVTDTERLREVAGGRFDIAIDLRVDSDTRPLLQLIDAGLRCGIGSRRLFPWLDVILPSERDIHSVELLRPEGFLVAPACFRTTMRPVSPFTLELTTIPKSDWIVAGPNMAVPRGRITARFGLSVHGPAGLFGASVLIDVVRDSDHLVVSKILKRRRQRVLTEAAVLQFVNEDETHRYDFRVYVEGQLFGGRLEFHGVELSNDRAAQNLVPRLHPMELHVGEQLLLLVQLLHDRVAAPDPEIPMLRAHVVGGSISPPDMAGRRARPRIVLAPVSNSEVRDWSLDAYGRLVGLLLERLDCDILLTGTRTQMEQLNRIVRANSEAGGRLQNLGGCTAWSDLPALLEEVDLIICNNSGIAHLAAASGQPTLAIYSGSHPPQEWGPQGRNVRVLVSEIGCSPCGFERLADCKNGHLCMRAITPERVADEAIGMLAAWQVKVAV